MGNLILNFLQQQGIIVVLGLMAVGGVFSQIVASRRYRKLRAGIQSLAALHTNGGMDKGGQLSFDAIAQADSGSVKSRRTSRRREVGRSDQDIVEKTDRKPPRSRRANQEPMEPVEATVHIPSSGDREELDSQLLYLKQSLDRIAAGRDQRLEEEAREHRKLTPEQEAIIVDILREYLS